MKNSLIFWLILWSALSLSQERQIEVLILGIAQDGGYPQTMCQKACCQDVLNFKSTGKYVSSLAIIDRDSMHCWLIDCTPDVNKQLAMLTSYLDGGAFALQGIFLSHAHIGHYLGLAQFGKEVMGVKELSVYAMPRMKTFLESNGPWDQLVTLKNIKIIEMENGVEIHLNNDIVIRPILVPHRDEYSETVGFELLGPRSKVLFIPDIDKWEKWDRTILDEVKRVDFALLDATFYSGNELGRNMDSIPHPSVLESMKILEPLTSEQKSKVHFIHMNHSNPILRQTTEREKVISLGFNIARQGASIDL
ncbi:MAG: MBL fold metallo-hydrolase [Vicingaceae bacterium]